MHSDEPRGVVLRTLPFDLEVPQVVEYHLGIRCCVTIDRERTLPITILGCDSTLELERGMLEDHIEMCFLCVFEDNGAVTTCPKSGVCCGGVAVLVGAGCEVERCGAGMGSHKGSRCLLLGTRCP